jgi:hypothetical protein
MTATTSRLNRITRLVVTSAALTCAWPATTSATPELFSEAVKQGLPAQGCQYCHVSQMPQKASYKPEDLNSRGKWLMTSKDKQGAKAVKADWLKEYPGGKD